MVKHELRNLNILTVFNSQTSIKSLTEECPLKLSPLEGAHTTKTVVIPLRLPVCN